MLVTKFSRGKYRKTGIVYPHRAEAFCTKMTKVSASTDGEQMWEECLDMVSQGDAEFKAYLQAVAGAIAIGKVYNESLIIAYGDGANGKSTVFNTIYEVLGDYAGKIPAEALTTRAKNAKVDLAELFGKRFILASETEEGQRLSTSMLKQIASVLRHGGAGRAVVFQVLPGKAVQIPLESTPVHLPHRWPYGNARQQRADGLVGRVPCAGYG